MKFNFPMSFSVTTLAWGVLEYWDAYVSAGQLDNVVDSIKWPLDYLIKCHIQSNGQTTRLYAQVTPIPKLYITVCIFKIKRMTFQII